MILGKAIVATDCPTGPREILSKAILIRKIVEFSPAVIRYKLTFKNKKFDDNGNILFQESTSCEVKDIKKTEKFLNALGYKKIMNIFETDTIVEKNNFKFILKEVKNGDNLIECETLMNNLNNTDELKNKFIEEKIPIQADDFFVKKAEIELEKVLNILKQEK